MSNTNSQFSIPTPLCITRLGKYSCTVDIFIAEDILYFPGHFPVQSVLPGVIIVDWCMEILKVNLGLDPTFLGLEALKFKKVIVPGKTVSFHVEYKEEKGKAYFRVDTEGEENASGRILFEKLSGEIC